MDPKTELKKELILLKAERKRNQIVLTNLETALSDYTEMKLQAEKTSDRFKYERICMATLDYMLSIRSHIESLNRQINNMESELAMEEPADPLLSMEALEWLKEQDYGSKSHEERLAFIELAKAKFPST